MNLRFLRSAGAAVALALSASASAQDPEWRHTGSLFLNTTPDGANLPAGTHVADFPVLIRLHGDFFNFPEAQPHGEDVRFSTNTGTPLACEIEQWDPINQAASLWVRVPQIDGNARQELRMHWGNPNAPSASRAATVFSTENGFASVWHLGAAVQDAAGTLESSDTGTTTTPGVIGAARHFPGKAGVFGGERIPNYPAGDAAHTTSLWFQAEKPNGTIIGWGNEGGGRGSKVRMQFRSPPHVHVDSDFSDIAGQSRLPMNEWIHVAHVYGDGPRQLYINGQLDSEAPTRLDIKSPARLWLGGWYHNYDFVGDLDEVRIARVARPAEWVRLEYENQKPLQTLVGLLMPPGATFAVSPQKATVAEGESVTFTAEAGGAQKLYWSLRRGDDEEAIVAVDRLGFRFDAGRVTGDQTASLRLRAIYPDGVKTAEIPIVVKEEIPDPVFTLKAPAAWDGRAPITIVPEFINRPDLQASGADDLQIAWTAGPFAVMKENSAGGLLLQRAMASGALTVTATIHNGGKAVTQSAIIAVTEPKHDPWVAREPAPDEKPEDGQFFARDASGEGTIFYRGKLGAPAEAVFLRLYADDQLVKTERAEIGPDGRYALSTRLRPGLIRYHVEFGLLRAGAETVVETVRDLVCGDAYLIDGQSNALATDTGEKSPPETSEWIRSYGRPPAKPGDAPGNLWCRPVWKAQQGEKAELGWWGMELAKQLVASQKVPIFLLNAAVGGTRIDQHQRDPSNPADLSTIYGRMLWRVQQAKLTHGIRAILWHQGENDQGAAGPTGGYGWETYQPLFVEMATGWKRDFPNLQQIYAFQIWPNACSMGGRDGSGDRLREKQRTLPRLFSSMSILSTLGIRPPGGCHFPLEGWGEFARLVQPLIERDFYGKVPAAPITPPNLIRAAFTDASRNGVSLAFDQPVKWDANLAEQFYLDGAKGRVASGSDSGNVLTLKLKDAATVKTITYLKEVAWSQETLLLGANGLAALTFCEVPIESAPPAKHVLKLTAPRERQIVQRNAQNLGTIAIAGSIENAEGAVFDALEARIVDAEKAGAWRQLPTDRHGATFSMTMELPAGGWYRLEVRAMSGGKAVAQGGVDHVGVGEIFVVAGQSNSANHGEEKQTTRTGKVVTFDGKNWQLANDPQSGASGGGGSFLPPFGDAMADRFGVPIGLVACGIGATSVREWLPGGVSFPNPPTIESRVHRLPSGVWESDGAAFTMLVQRMQQLGPQGFRAVLWHQGESDANQRDASRTLPGPLYREYLETVIQQARRAIGWDAPWFVAQVSYHTPADESSPEIREAQAALWHACVALEGPDSDALRGDLRENGGRGVHFSGAGLRAHAARWVEKVVPWLAKQPGIRFSIQ